MAEHASPHVAESLAESDRQQELADIVMQAVRLEGPNVNSHFGYHSGQEAEPVDNTELTQHAEHMRAVFMDWSGNEFTQLDRQVTIFETKRVDKGDEHYKVRTQQALGYHEGETHFLVGLEISLPHDVWIARRDPYMTSHTLALGIHSQASNKTWETIRAVSFMDVVPDITTTAEQTRRLRGLLDDVELLLLKHELIGIRDEISDSLLQTTDTRMRDLEILGLWTPKIVAVLESFKLDEQVYDHVLQACSTLLEEHILRERSSLALGDLDLLHPTELHLLRTIFAIT